MNVFERVLQIYLFGDLEKGDEVEGHESIGKYEKNGETKKFHYPSSL